MPTIYHKYDKDYRVMQRGKLWYVQQDSHAERSSIKDHWHDIAKPQDTIEAALIIMHQRKPLPQVA